MTNEDREPAANKRDEGMAGGGGARGEKTTKEAAQNAGGAGKAVDKQVDREREMQADMNRNKPPA